MSELDCLMIKWVSVVWTEYFTPIFVIRNFPWTILAKIEASGDPGWCHMGIQNQAMEVNARIHQ